MRNVLEVAKRFLGAQINKSVLKQKNEWPATSIPVYFQPERPKKDTVPNKSMRG